MSADAARGMLLGLAVGDALGAPVEFLKLEQIEKRYGPGGVADLPAGKALFTDDTQLSMAVAEALAEAGAEPLEVLMAAVTRRFVAWLDSPDNVRAPGLATIRACKRLRNGVPWNLAGDRGSKGCGSVMRTAPVGFYFRNDPAGLRAAARTIGAATHPHPTADAACLGAAWAVGLAASGVPPRDWTAGVREAVRGLSGEVSAVLDRVNAAPADGRKGIPRICANSKGWTADEILGAALYCSVRHADDFSAGVLASVNNSGDSDSIGCLTGALLGARLGVGAIPARWLERIERRGDLEDLADRLAAASP